MKQIWCVSCKTSLGELAAGSKIKKGIAFLCDSCDTKRIASDMMNKNKKTDYNDMFNNIFGGFKK